MAVYNAQPYLRAAIDSVLAQTFRDFQLIIIDDCSTDDGWPVIAAAAARDPRITALRRDHQGGASAGLNQGLSLATGEFITRQDSDDVSAPTRLAEQVSFLDANPEVGAVGTAVAIIDESGRQFSTWNVPETDQAIQSTLLETMCCCGPTMMARRRVLDRLEFRFDEALSGSEDYDFCLRVGEVTRLANLRQPVYHYRQHSSSVSRSREHEQLARKAAALEHALERRFGSVPPAAAARTAARDYVAAALLGHLRGRKDGSREWLDRARRLHAPVLDDVEWLARVIRSSAPPTPVAVAVERTQSLFEDVLPQNLALWWLQRRLTAELHMKEVFAAGNGPDRARRQQHLWSALRSNPAWLANRGVLSLLVKGALVRSSAGSLT
jgi:glycosyltransferase involved in cell wall biosynthesis